MTSTKCLHFSGLALDTGVQTWDHDGISNIYVQRVHLVPGTAVLISVCVCVCMCVCLCAGVRVGERETERNVKTINIYIYILMWLNVNRII